MVCEVARMDAGTELDFCTAAGPMLGRVVWRLDHNLYVVRGQDGELYRVALSITGVGVKLEHE